MNLPFVIVYLKDISSYQASYLPFNSKQHKNKFQLSQSLWTKFYTYFKTRCIHRIVFFQTFRNSVN